MKGDLTRLRQDDLAIMRIVMPDFPAHLQVDYLASDGTIAHLVADDGHNLLVLTKDGMKPVGASHLYRAGETVIIGEPDPALGFEGWEINEPFGTDMIIAIASAVPLREAPPPASDTGVVYFRDLRAALETAEAAGQRLSGQAVLLETVPR